MTVSAYERGQSVEGRMEPIEGGYRVTFNDYELAEATRDESTGVTLAWTTHQTAAQVIGACLSGGEMGFEAKISSQRPEDSVVDQNIVDFIDRHDVDGVTLRRPGGKRTIGFSVRDDGNEATMLVVAQGPDLDLPSEGMLPVESVFGLTASSFLRQKSRRIFGDLLELVGVKEEDRGSE